MIFEMERIEIYTSRKKSFGVLIMALIMVAASAWLVMDAEDFQGKEPILVRTAGVAGMLFFGFGVFVAVSRLIKNRLFLVIDDEGIDVDPTRPSSEKIAWRHIEGFSEISIHGTKIIVIHVDNPEYWIANERSPVRRRMMKFNLGYCGSPFGIGAGAARISHGELWRMLNEHFDKFTAGGSQ